MTTLINGDAKVNTLINGATKKVALDPASSTVNKGLYDATLLETVDADLAAANIVAGKQIFGINGAAAAGTATQDIQNSALAAAQGGSSGSTLYQNTESILAGAEFDLATLTQTYSAGSLTEAFGFCAGRAGNANTIKIRLYMDGVQVAETAYLDNVDFQPNMVVGNRAISGNKIVKIASHNYDVATRSLYIFNGLNGGNYLQCAVFAGSVKVV